MNRTRVALSISLPPALALRLEEIQKEEHRSRSEVIREALRSYFDSKWGLALPFSSPVIQCEQRVNGSEEQMAGKVRYTIDITEELDAEVILLASRLGGIAKSELWRRALGLYKAYQEAVSKGEHVGVGRDGAQSLKQEFILS